MTQIKTTAWQLIAGIRKGAGGRCEYYDYANHAWVGTDGRYLSCDHPDAMKCKCFGRIHAGEPVAENAELA